MSHVYQVKAGEITHHSLRTRVEDRAEGVAATPCASTKSAAEMTEGRCMMSDCPIDVEADVNECSPVE
jgi:hypothetical protein